MQRLTRSVLWLALALAPACGVSDKGPTPISAGEAADSFLLVDDEAALLVTTVNGTALPKPGGGVPRDVVTAEQEASLASAQMVNHFAPSGCLTATLDGATATYTFSDCTGPPGLDHVSGTLSVVYDLSPDGILTEASATGLHLNGASLDIAAGATYITSGTARTLMVVTGGQGEGPFGHTLTREGPYSMIWDESCRTMYGDWAVGKDGPSTTVSAVTSCNGGCPTAGGTISYSEVGGRTITITFDGSAKAAWSSSGGGKGTLDLDCTVSS